MISSINSVSLHGIDGYTVSVESDVQNGIPIFNMVGLPDAAVKESKERVRVAIKNSGYDFPLGKILINFAPAHLKKEGSHFDLSIAVGILHNVGSIKDFPSNEYSFIGELSLNGDIKPIIGVLAMVLSAKKNNIKSIFIPSDNIKEVNFIEGINIYPCKCLLNVINHLNGENLITKLTPNDIVEDSDYDYNNFSEVKGQTFAKRACEISASGNHNIIFIGPPGTGKSLLSRCMPSIIPSLSKQEAIEVNSIHSITGAFLNSSKILKKIPFRSPHHTSSVTSIIGGGTSPTPGEISLSHLGILYLDEIPEFKRDAIEALRDPLETGTVTISRVKGRYIYPCKFLLIASMNPCKCGFWGYPSPSKSCRCNDFEIKQYLSKISGPIMDRIDLHISVENIKYKEIMSPRPEEDSREILKRVVRCREIQAERFKGDNIKYNSQMKNTHIRKYCNLSPKSNRFLESAYDTLSLSSRSINKIIKISRTIADLDFSPNITEDHIAEALQYRYLDRNII
ncbi:MAG: YifB family Mg chelatase-like AAA ATPase [Clostridium sp.]